MRKCTTAAKGNPVQTTQPAVQRALLVAKRGDMSDYFISCKPPDAFGWTTDTSWGLLEPALQQTSDEFEDLRAKAGWANLAQKST